MERVLVVDGLSETADVLRAVLSPRGVDVSRIRGDQSQPIDAIVPRVVVIHEEEHGEAETAEWPNVPRVVIGSGDCTVVRTSEKQRYLQKPFQYSELVFAVERLLSDNRDAA